MEIKESGLTFCFTQETALKFDDSVYYRKCFESFPGAKGVDMLCDSPNHLVFLEVKNCLGHEADNRWRIVPDNKKSHIAPQTGRDRDSLDIEVAEKVAMTITCLMGATTFGKHRTSATPLLPFAIALNDKNIAKREKKLLVILFLEGNFGGHTRSKKMQMEALQVSLQKKLKWLNCCISVVDSDTYNKKIFTLAPQLYTI